MDAVLKIMGDKDEEQEILQDNYQSVIPELSMAQLGSDPEGLTGDELLQFIDSNEQGNKGLCDPS